MLAKALKIYNEKEKEKATEAKTEGSPGSTGVSGGMGSTDYRKMFAFELHLSRHVLVLGGFCGALFVILSLFAWLSSGIESRRLELSGKEWLEACDLLALREVAIIASVTMLLFSLFLDDNMKAYLFRLSPYFFPDEQKSMLRSVIHCTLRALMGLAISHYFVTSYFIYCLRDSGKASYGECLRMMQRLVRALLVAQFSLPLHATPSFPTQLITTYPTDRYIKGKDFLLLHSEEIANAADRYFELKGKKDMDDRDVKFLEVKAYRNAQHSVVSTTYGRFRFMILLWLALYAYYYQNPWTAAAALFIVALFHYMRVWFSIPSSPENTEVLEHGGYSPDGAQVQSARSVGNFGLMFCSVLALAAVWIGFDNSSRFKARFGFNTAALFAAIVLL